MIPSPTGATAQRFAPDTHLLSIRFVHAWPDGRALFDQGLPLVLEDNKFPALRTSAEALIKACRIHADVRDMLWDQRVTTRQYLHIETVFAAFVLEWAAALEQSGCVAGVEHAIDSRVQAALTLLERADLSITELARRLSLSRSQLDRLFSDVLGCTPRGYKEQRRVTRVREALRYSADPIKTIAYREGFRRLSHFSAWFTRATGLSPRRYRGHS